MSFNIRYSKNSKIELKEIYLYMSYYSNFTADRFLKKLRKFIDENLSFMPTMFKIYKDNVRLVPYKNYIIFYEINKKNNSVEILHIIHWARDLSKLNF